MPLNWQTNLGHDVPISEARTKGAALFKNPAMSGVFLGSFKNERQLHGISNYALGKDIWHITKEML